MKIYNYISMFLLAGATIVASCSQNEELGEENLDSLQGFQISVSDDGFIDTETGRTRAVESGYATRFSNGDAIGIFAVRGGVGGTIVEEIKNRKFTMVDGYWELSDGGDPIEYKGSQFQKMSFYAYYPYNADVTFDPSNENPFETYIKNWTIGADQNEGNYTQYDLMTSIGSVKGDRLKGQIAFDMKHQMALAVVKMPKLTYSFTNGGIDDYLLPVATGSFTLNNNQASPFYQASTDTYRFLVNPNKGFTIKGTYTGVSEMEYEAKGTLEGGTAKMYTIEDKTKINHTLQIGDYFCADGKIVSVDAETVPDNVIGIVAFVGNPQPSVTHANLYTADNDALHRDFPACTHGVVLSVKNSLVEETATHMFHSSKAGYYSNWFTADEDWANKFIGCNTESDVNKNDASLVFPALMGYNNTQILTMCYEGKGDVTTCDWAYMHIKAYREAEAVPTNVTPWYLPSIMCLDKVAVNMNAINSSLQNVNGDKMVSVEANANTGHYWSSTQRSPANQWTHGMGGGRYHIICERGSRAGYFRMMLAF